MKRYIKENSKITCDDEFFTYADNSTEQYYEIMNILDDYAIREESLSDSVIDKLDRMALNGGAISIREYIRGIADANDCGICNTWQEVVDALAELFEEGERGPVDVPMEDWEGKRWYKNKS